MDYADVEGRREWAHAASDLVNAVNRDEPVNDVIARIASHALGLLELDMCAVMMPNPTQDRLMVVGSAGLSDTYIRRLHSEHPLTVEHGGAARPSPSVEAYVSGRTVAVSDIESAPAMAAWRELALAEGYGALIATPLSEGDEIAGVIVGYSRDKREFTDEQVELLAMFAVHAAATIQSAHRRDELNTTVSELHKANDVLRRQSRNLQTLDRQHRRLMQVMANDVGMSGVVTMLAELLDCSVTVEDPAGKVLATATRGAYVPPPRDAERLQPHVAESLQKILSARSGSVFIGGEDATSVPFWAASATLSNEVVAVLWVGRAGLTLDEVSRRGLERFALAVALEISKQRSEILARLRLSRDVIADLLSGVSTHDRTSILERAAALGHPLDVTQRIVVVRPDGPPNGAPPRRNVVDAADAAARAMGVDALVGAASGHAVMLVPAGSVPTPREFAVRTVAEFRRRNDGRTASAVVGATVDDIAGITAAFRAARGALDLMSDRIEAVSDLSDVGVAALLLSHGDTVALERFAQSVLSPVTSLDARRASELIATLTTWLEEDRSTSRAAQRLNVHVNTVTQRLNAFEQAVGRPIRNPAFLVDLQVALSIRRINQLSDEM